MICLLLSILLIIFINPVIKALVFHFVVCVTGKTTLGIVSFHFLIIDDNE